MRIENTAGQIPENTDCHVNEEQQKENKSLKTMALVIQIN